MGRTLDLKLAKCLQTNMITSKNLPNQNPLTRPRTHLTNKEKHEETNDVINVPIMTKIKPSTSCAKER